MDVNLKHLRHVLEPVARQKGLSFVDIHQNRVAFNDTMFARGPGRGTKSDTTG